MAAPPSSSPPPLAFPPTPSPILGLPGWGGVEGAPFALLCAPPPVREYAKNPPSKKGSGGGGVPDTGGGVAPKTPRSHWL